MSRLGGGGRFFQGKDILTFRFLRGFPGGMGGWRALETR